MRQLDRNFVVGQPRIESLRQKFGDALFDLAVQRDDVAVLFADLASAVGLQNAKECLRRLAGDNSEEFERLGHKFVEVGVAEQNLVGVASGLAHMGQTPFAISYAAFNPAVLIFFGKSALFDLLSCNPDALRKFTALHIPAMKGHITFMHAVLQTDLNGIQSDLTAALINERLYGKVALAVTIPTESACRDQVGIYKVGITFTGLISVEAVRTHRKVQKDLWSRP